MPDNKSISQLTTAEQTTSSDLFETSIPNGSLGYLSRKVSLDSIADYIGNDHLFSSDLQTTNKTLTGAINEAAQSGGGASIEEMTMAEYNALTPEQKADGTLRAISDATTSISDIDDVNLSSPADGNVLAFDSTSSKWVNREIEADAVAYDNTSSGLTATDVNAAIDEMSEKIEAIGGITEHDSPSVSVSSGTFATLESFSVPKGTYIIITTFNQADSNQQGFRIGLIDRTETSANTSINSILATGRATIQKTRVFVIPSTTTIYIRVYQNSGSAINMNSHTEIVRIK